jgi:hypothetical protein
MCLPACALVRQGTARVHGFRREGASDGGSARAGFHAEQVVEGCILKAIPALAEDISSKPDGRGWPEAARAG